jgi:hypothetical protein
MKEISSEENADGNQKSKGADTPGEKKSSSPQTAAFCVLQTGGEKNESQLIEII